MAIQIGSKSLAGARDHVAERKNFPASEVWQLRYLVEQMPVILWTIDKNFRFTSSMGSGLRLLGLSSSQMVGKTLGEFFKDERPDSVPSTMHSRALMGYPANFDYSWDSKHFQISLEPLRNRVGRIIGCIGLALDISEQKQTQEAINRQVEEMTVLYSVAMAANQAASEEELIFRTTQLISEKLYPEFLSVLLIDEETGGLRTSASYRKGEPITRVASLPQGISITGRVAAEGEIHRVANAQAEPVPPGIRPGMRSAVCVPIKSGGRTIGVMDAESPQPMAFNGKDERLLTTFSGLLATAIDKMRLFEATRRRNAELEALRQAGLRLASSLELQPVLDAILANATKLVSGDSAHIFIQNHDGLLFAASLRVHDDQSDSEIMADLHNFINEVAEQRRLLVVTDTAAHPAFERQEWRGAIVGLPLSVADQMHGVMTVIFDTPHRFDDTELRVLSLLGDQAAIALENARLYRDMEEAYLETVLALARAMDARDSYTADHSQRLAAWAEAIAQSIGCMKEDIQAIRWAALLHDIGKIGIPDQILRKPGPLTDEEWELMREHPSIGAEIIKPVRRLSRVVPLVLSHQEKWDGSGYPNQLSGDQIPIGARILAVVDAFGAITDDRVYRPARSSSEALDELEKCSGSQFDPKIVEVMLQLRDRLAYAAD